MGNLNVEELVAKVEKLVTPVLEELKLSLVDVEYVQEGGYFYLRIYVENLDGDITLEDCATISNRIDEDVDKLIDQKFFLEVSSPGIERPLKKIEDYIRFEGEKVKVQLKHKINDTKNFTGIIDECRDNIVMLKIDNNILELPFKEIKKGNLVYEFDEF